MNANDETVTQCSDGSWCCGTSSNTTDCCNQGKGVWIVDGEATTLRPSASSDAPSSSLSVTATASTTSGANPPSKTSSTSPAAIIAIVTAAVIGTFVMVMGVVCCLMGRGRGRRYQLRSYGNRTLIRPSELDARNDHDGLHVVSSVPASRREQLYTISELEQPNVMIELEEKAKEPVVEIREGVT